MAFAKKKAAPPEPTAEEKLLADLYELRARLEEYISGRVLVEKATSHGRDLPIQVLRASLTRNDESCLCRCAARLLGDRNA